MAGIVQGSPFGRARLFLLNMAAAGAMVTIAHTFPAWISGPLLCVGYGSLVAEERRHGVFNPVSVTLVAMSVLLAVFGRTLEAGGWYMLAPVAIFGSLFSIGAVSLACRRPMTTFISSGLGTPALHWITSGLWTAVYGIGLILVWLTPSHPLLLLAAPALVWLAVVASLYLHLVDLGPAFRRAPALSAGRFHIRESADTADIKSFYRHFVREALPSIRRGSGPRSDAFESLVARKMEADRQGWPRTRFFLATDGDEVVGTIACMDDDPRLGLPAESEHDRPFSLEPLRRFGPVLEVARFSIAKQHRFGQDLIRGLFRCAIERALERDAAFLVTQAYETALPMYRKIGFVPLMDRPVSQHITGVAIVIAVLNLQRKVIGATGDDGPVAEDIPPYLAERYVKRRALGRLLGRRAAWALSDKDILSLIVPENIR